MSDDSLYRDSKTNFKVRVIRFYSRGGYADFGDFAASDNRNYTQLVGGKIKRKRS